VVLAEMLMERKTLMVPSAWFVTVELSLTEIEYIGRARMMEMRSEPNGGRLPNN
jgi:hypothetical protein